MQVQIDNGFASMKQCIGRQFVTLNDNVRRFGGAMQAGDSLGKIQHRRLTDRLLGTSHHCHSLRICQSVSFTGIPQPSLLPTFTH